jgi:hypothetical protein
LHLCLPNKGYANGAIVALSLLDAVDAFAQPRTRALQWR